MILTNFDQLVYACYQSGVLKKSWPFDKKDTANIIKYSFFCPEGRNFFDFVKRFKKFKNYKFKFSDFGIDEDFIIQKLFDKKFYQLAEIKRLNLLVPGFLFLKDNPKLLNFLIFNSKLMFAQSDYLTILNYFPEIVKVLENFSLQKFKNWLYTFITKSIKHRIEKDFNSLGLSPEVKEIAENLPKPFKLQISLNLKKVYMDINIDKQISKLQKRLKNIVKNYKHADTEKAVSVMKSLCYLVNFRQVLRNRIAESLFHYDFDRFIRHVEELLKKNCCFSIPSDSELFLIYTNNLTEAYNLKNYCFSLDRLELVKTLKAKMIQFLEKYLPVTIYNVFSSSLDWILYENPYLNSLLSSDLTEKDILNFLLNKEISFRYCSSNIRFPYNLLAYIYYGAKLLKNNDEEKYSVFKKALSKILTPWAYVFVFDEIPESEYDPDLLLSILKEMVYILSLFTRNYLVQRIGNLFFFRFNGEDIILEIVPFTLFGPVEPLILFQTEYFRVISDTNGNVFIKVPKRFYTLNAC